MTQLEQLKKDKDCLKEQIMFLLKYCLAATSWSPHHTSANNNKYQKGTLVWYEGYVYECLVSNNSIPVNNEYYWHKINLGHLLAQEVPIPTTPAISVGIPHATALGTDTYTATISGVTSYTDGDAYLIRFTNGNTTGSTLNINSLGAVPLYRNNNVPLLGGDIISGGEMLCVYNLTSNIFQVIGITQISNIRRHSFEGIYDYNGYAPFGSSENSNVWTITRILISSNGSTIVEKALNVAWTDRISVIYS